MRDRGIKTFRSNAAWLKKIRVHNRMSLRELGREIGVDHSKIHRIEHGKDASAIDYITLMLWATNNDPVY